MKFSALQSFIRNNFFVLLLAAAGFSFIVLLANYGGIGLSPDSIAYTSVAQSIAQHGTLNQYDDAPYVDFPAGYPFFLSVFFKLFGYDYVHTGIYINALLFAVLIWLCGTAMQKFARTSTIHRLVILLIIVFSPALLEVYSMLWSETLFILLLVLLMTALHRYVQKPAASTLLVAALVAALLCITRYAGIAFIGAAGFVLLLMPHQSVKQKSKHIIFFVLIATSLLAINFVRNYFQEGDLTGEREKSITPLLSNIYYFGLVVCNWLSLSTTNTLIVTGTGIVCLGLLTAALLWHVITKKYKPSYEYIATVFACSYCWFIIGIASISRFETIDSRLIAPAFIPMVWVAAFWLNNMVTLAQPRLKIFCIGLSLLIGISFIAAECNSSVASYNDIKDYGIPGYTDDDWRLSPTVQFIKKHAYEFDTTTIYSNANDAVYFFTRQHAQQLPHKEFPNEIKELLEEDAFYIIWFNFTDNNDDVSLQYILQHRPMQCLQKFTDGAIYVTKDSLNHN